MKIHSKARCFAMGCPRCPLYLRDSPSCIAIHGVQLRVAPSVGRLTRYAGVLPLSSGDASLRLG